MRRGTYPGGKAGAGVYQALINQIPPHDTYIALCAGRDALAWLMRPAPETVLLDPDPAVCAWWPPAPGRAVLQERGEDYAARRTWTGREFVFVDPPYLRAVRSSGRAYYAVEMLSESEHLAFLEVVRGIPAPVMITHYPCDLYAQQLLGWRYMEVQGRTRKGPLRTEGVWMNYPEPMELHDYRYLGSNFRERWRFAKQKRRWVARLESMPRLQRLALRAAIYDSAGDSATSGGGIPAPHPALSAAAPHPALAAVRAGCGAAGHQRRMWGCDQAEMVV